MWLIKCNFPIILHLIWRRSLRSLWPVLTTVNTSKVISVIRKGYFFYQTFPKYYRWIENLYQLDGIYSISNYWFTYHSKCSLCYSLSLSRLITNYNLIITLCISDINCSDVIISNIICLTWYCDTWHWMSTLVLKWFELLQLMIWIHETRQLIFKFYFVIRLDCRDYSYINSLNTLHLWLSFVFINLNAQL